MKKALPVFLLLLASCRPTDHSVPTVGFADAFVDNTLDQAKQGFFAALSDSGFSEDKKTVRVLYRNAQGSPITLAQVVKYFVSEKVDLIGANPSAATVAALQGTKDIPVFMMVSPIPEQMNETGATNLYGVADTQDYIDTSFALIKEVVKPQGSSLTVGMIYNQSEPQSVDALKRIQALAQQLQVTVVALPVNSTADVQLVTQSLLTHHIDAFFANPDNTVFGAFETIIQSCNNAHVPVFTSEAGLVARGAVAAYGADIYQWGYQSGAQAAHFLKARSADPRATPSAAGVHWAKVIIRKRVFNPTAAAKFGLTLPSTFQPLH